MTNRRAFMQQAGLGLALMTTDLSAADKGAARSMHWRSPSFGPKPVARGSRGMVICSNPAATQAGIDVLRAGGNAVDAALCTAATQTATEPHMTTITGVLCFLYYSAAEQKTYYMNGGMNAPLAGTPAADGRRPGGSAAVGGWWAGFEAGLSRFGTRSKAELLRPAIEYARQGFPVYPFLYGELFEQSAKVGVTAPGRETFMPKGYVLSPGEILKQPAMARTLERLVAEGNSFFYHGQFARDFCKVVQEAGGVITPEDFARYEVRWQEPARGSYHGYDIAASPIPDTGGTHVIETLNMLEQLPIRQWGPPTDSPDTLYWMARLANEVYVDGARQTDPAHHEVPLDLITSKEYASMRLALYKMAPVRTSAAPTAPGSNQVTVADGQGNVVTLFHSCMASPWSNGLFVHGVSIAAQAAHLFRARTGSGERASPYPASNMIFKNGRVVLASGSPGVGVLGNILQNTVNLLDFGMPIEESVMRPRYGSSSGERAGIMVEVDLDEKVRQAAERKGLDFNVVSPWNFHNGAFEAIHFDAASNTMVSRADPRRSGWSEAV